MVRGTRTYSRSSRIRISQRSSTFTLGRTWTDSVTRLPHQRNAIGGLYSLCSGTGTFDGDEGLWLTKPKGIGYLAFRSDVLACCGRSAEIWQRELGLGPTQEFMIFRSTARHVPKQWRTRRIPRRRIFPPAAPAKPAAHPLSKPATAPAVRV